jgi:hypothetical protein
MPDRNFLDPANTVKLALANNEVLPLADPNEVLPANQDKVTTALAISRAGFVRVDGGYTGFDQQGLRRDAVGNRLPMALKEAAPWATVGFCLPAPATFNNGAQPSAVLLQQHCNAWFEENTHKWVYQETTKNLNYATWDWSLSDQLATSLATLAPAVIGRRAMHLVIGWGSLANNAYHPPYVATELGTYALQSEINGLVLHRHNGMKTKYPGIGSGAVSDPFYRIDVVNEITNQATTSSGGSFGWRQDSENVFRGREIAIGGAGTAWIRHLFGLQAAEYPTSSRCWGDFQIEYGAPVEGGNTSVNNGTLVIGITNGSNVFTTTSMAGRFVGEFVIGSGIPANTTIASITSTGGTLSAAATATNASLTATFSNYADPVVYQPNVNDTYRWERMLFEIWDMNRAAGSRVCNGVNFQLHTRPRFAVDLDGFRSQMQHLNALGIKPHVTEHTASVGNASRIPGIVGTNTDRARIWGARYNVELLKVMLADSEIDEVSGWSLADNEQPWWSFSETFPLLTETIKALRDAVPRGARTLRASRRLDFHTFMRPYVTVGAGITITSVSSRLRVTGTASASQGITVPWEWYNHASMARPILPQAFIACFKWFQPVGLPNNARLFGYGAQALTDHVTFNYGSANNEVRVTTRRASTASMTDFVIGNPVPNVMNNIVLRVDGNLLQASLNQGPWVNLTMPSSINFSMASVVNPMFWFAGDQDGANLATNIELCQFEMHRLADYPLLAEARDLGPFRSRTNKMPLFMAA